MLNKIWLGMAVVVMGMLGGCASPGNITISNVTNAHKLAKDNTGVVYGVWMSPDDLHRKGVTVKNACDSINNTDSRCNDQDNYKIGFVVVNSGFMAGLADVITLMNKTMNVSYCTLPGSTCTFLKVKAVNGKFGEIIDVASVPGDKKCYWSGMPGAGGTVCPEYKWDSGKDLHSFDTLFQKMTVSDK